MSLSCTIVKGDRFALPDDSIAVFAGAACGTEMELNSRGVNDPTNLAVVVSTTMVARPARMLVPEHSSCELPA